MNEFAYKNETKIFLRLGHKIQINSIISYY